MPSETSGQNPTATKVRREVDIWSNSLYIVHSKRTPTARAEADMADPVIVHTHVQKSRPEFRTIAMPDSVRKALHKLIRSQPHSAGAQAPATIDKDGILVAVVRTEKTIALVHSGQPEQAPASRPPPEPFELEPTSADPEPESAAADQDKLTAELMADIEEALASVDVRPPVHFTQNIRGPADVNRFGLSMDFDMTVLWVAAWYRRGEADRKRLLKDLKWNNRLRVALGSQNALDAWVSDMENALNAILPSNAANPKPMSLAEITALIKRWNQAREFLRGADGSDLLERIGHGTDLIKHLALLLIDEQGKRTIFTADYDVSPGWTALNFFRLWTVIGREHHLPAITYGPRESDEFLQSWMDSDRIGKQ